MDTIPHEPLTHKVTLFTSARTPYGKQRVETTPELAWRLTHPFRDCDVTHRWKEGSAYISAWWDEFYRNPRDFPHTSEKLGDYRQMGPKMMRDWLSYKDSPKAPLDYDDLIQWCKERSLKQWHGQCKQSLAAWSPASFKEKKRSKDLVQEVSCLVADYDDGTEYEEALEHWSDIAECIMHTTWSHTKAHHKFRVILPLVKPLKRDNFHRAWHWLYETSEQKIDKACKDPSRIFYGFSIPTWQIPSSNWQRRKPMLELTEAMLPAPRVAAPIQPKRPAPPGGSKFVDRSERLGLAVRKKAYIKGGVARDLECPQCHRRSVWYYLDSSQKRTASCNHMNSCGWFGFLDELDF